MVYLIIKAEFNPDERIEIMNVVGMPIDADRLAQKFFKHDASIQAIIEFTFEGYKERDKTLQGNYIYIVKTRVA